MKRLSAGKLLLWWVLALVGWEVIAILCLTVGSTGRFIAWPTPEVLELRRERVLLASLVGAGLASAGVGYQAILRNVLADPYLLGASSGATLFAFAWTLPAAALGGSAWAVTLGQQGSAFIGALLAVLTVLLLAGGRGRLDPTRAILVGVIVSTICGSLLMLLIPLFATPGGIAGSFEVLFGKIRTGLTASEIRLAGILILGSTLVLVAVAGALNAAALGEEESRALGVRIGRLRWIVLCTSSLGVAAAVAIAGPIGFIGLVAPHLGRLLTGPDNRRLLPVALALGAGLLAIADTGVRALARPELLGTALPVGVVTGLLGGPFFLLLLWSRRGRLNA